MPTSFPGAHNTGVPAGVTLTRYTSPCTILQDGKQLVRREIRCGRLVIKAKNVVIRQSKVVGVVNTEAGGSVTIEDSEVDAGKAYAAAVGHENIKIYRSNIHGGQHSVQCAAYCHIQDSWLHGQYLPPDGEWHLNAFISNGGHDMTLIHNTLACDNPGNSVGGGCTADASLFGDFAGNRNIRFERNLFVASSEFSYCTYAGYQENKKYGTEVANIVYIDNVFQRGRNSKCGGHGPVTGFNSRSPGNVWSGNVWDDGTPVRPSL